MRLPVSNVKHLEIDGNSFAAGAKYFVNSAKQFATRAKFIANDLKHSVNGNVIDLIQIRNIEYIYDGRIANRNLGVDPNTPNVQIKIGLLQDQDDACILPLTNVSTLIANVDNHLTPTPVKAIAENTKIILTISGGNITSGKIDILLKGFGYF